MSNIPVGISNTAGSNFEPTYANFKPTQTLAPFKLSKTSLYFLN